MISPSATLGFSTLRACPCLLNTQLFYLLYIVLQCLDCCIFQGTVTDFQTSKRDIISNAQGAAELLRGLLFERLPGYLNKMSASNLHTAFTSDGLSGMRLPFVLVLNVNVPACRLQSHRAAVCAVAPAQFAHACSLLEEALSKHFVVICNYMCVYVCRCYQGTVVHR